MKVLLVNSVYGSGSTGRICAQLASAVTGAGDECLVACSRGRKEPVAGEKLFHIGNEFDICLHGAKTRLFDAHGLASAGATKRFLEAVRRYDPDVIHLHNIHGYYLQYELLFEALRAGGKPVIWTFHDCWPFTGHCAYFDMAGCDRWMTGCGACPQRRTYPASLFADGSTRNWRKKKAAFSGLKRLTIVTPSSWLAELVRESFLGGYPTEVIPNGVDTAVFREIPEEAVLDALPDGVERGRYLLGVANVWEPRKGLNDFLALAERLADTSMKILLVGLDDAQIRALPANIIGLKRTASAEALAALYSGCAAYLNLTYEENYPTTNLEAAACGANVITYASGGCDETLHACSAAVPKGDIDAVERLTRSLPLPIKEDAPCQPLDSKVCVERYLELYHRALL